MLTGAGTLPLPHAPDLDPQALRRPDYPRALRPAAAPLRSIRGGADLPVSGYRRARTRPPGTCWATPRSGELAAYTRLFGAGISYPEASIGRVVVQPPAPPRRPRPGADARVAGGLERLFGPQPIQIGAQLYLQAFYESFGFRQVGEGYLEDDIPHIHMVRA